MVPGVSENEINYCPIQDSVGSSGAATVPEAMYDTLSSFSSDSIGISFESLIFSGCASSLPDPKTITLENYSIISFIFAILSNNPLTLPSGLVPIFHQIMSFLHREPVPLFAYLKDSQHAIAHFSDLRLYVFIEENITLLLQTSHNPNLTEYILNVIIISQAFLMEVQNSTLTKVYLLDIIKRLDSFQCPEIRSVTYHDLFHACAPHDNQSWLHVFKRSIFRILNPCSQNI